MKIDIDLKLTHILIFMLNLNEFHAPKKTQTGRIYIKNKTCIYGVHKTPTSDLGTHTL